MIKALLIVSCVLISLSAAMLLGYAAGHKSGWDEAYSELSPARVHNTVEEGGQSFNCIPSSCAITTYTDKKGHTAVDYFCIDPRS